MHLSRDDNRLAKLIEESIPDSLRLAKHPDAELVNLAIATVLLAIKESSSFTLRGQRHDIREALEGYFGHTFAPHIAKEDEDWGALQSRAKSAEDIRQELHNAIGQAVQEFKQGSEASHASAYEKAMAAFRANPRAVLSDIPGTTSEEAALSTAIKEADSTGIIPAAWSCYVVGKAYEVGNRDFVDLNWHRAEEGLKATAREFTDSEADKVLKSLYDNALSIVQGMRGIGSVNYKEAGKEVFSIFKKYNLREEGLG